MKLSDRKLSFNQTNFLASPFRRTEEVKKPPVPKKDEKPIHGLVSDKNFIVANAVENILAGNSMPGSTSL